MTGMTIDWGSLGLVTAVTVLGTAFILTICSLAARMLATVHAKHEINFPVSISSNRRLVCHHDDCCVMLFGGFNK